MRSIFLNETASILQDGAAPFWMKDVGAVSADFTIASVRPGAEEESTIQAGTDVVASALVNSANTNLTSFTANPDNSARNGAFTSSSFDVFGVTDRSIN
ncbi:MAG: hypothetical protein AAFR74_09240, partial [Pseudomonadota bacterium]